MQIKKAATHCFQMMNPDTEIAFDGLVVHHIAVGRIDPLLLIEN